MGSLNIFSMFYDASWLVKVVVLILLIMSIYSWAIIIFKALSWPAKHRELKKLIRILKKDPTKKDIYLTSVVLSDMEKHLSFLATVSSSAPFIGLFGTVWGIIDSFYSIALYKSGGFIVVAPGISEALFATAVGLFAAIPANIAYNKFLGDVIFYENKLDSIKEASGI